MLWAHEMKSDEKPFFCQIYAIFWGKMVHVVIDRYFSLFLKGLKIFPNPKLSLIVPLIVMHRWGISSVDSSISVVIQEQHLISCAKKLKKYVFSQRRSQTFPNEGVVRGPQGRGWSGHKLAVLHRPLYKVSFSFGEAQGGLLTEGAQAPSPPPRYVPVFSR